MPAHSAQSMASLDLFEHFMDLTYAYKFGPMPCDAVVATLRDPNGKQLAQAFHFPGGISALQEPDVGLSATATMVDAHTVELIVRTQRLAKGVYFDVPGYQAEDEFFHLAPNCEAHVLLRRTGTQPLIGTVHAINSGKEARLDMAAFEGSAVRGGDSKNDGFN
jgi:beta-mannosidase